MVRKGDDHRRHGEGWSGSNRNRAKEFNVFLNRFTPWPSAASFHYPSQTDPTSSWPPQLLFSHTSSVIRTNDSHGVSSLPTSPTMDFTATSTPPPPQETELPFVSPTCSSVSSSKVTRQLEILCQNKALGLDGINPGSWRLAQISNGIRQHLFNLSLGKESVTVLWKTLWFIPVPKKSEVYLPHWGWRWECHHLLASHLDEVVNTVRIIVIDFSSAFSINCLNFCVRSSKMQVDTFTTSWIIITWCTDHSLRWSRIATQEERSTLYSHQLPV